MIRSFADWAARRSGLAARDDRRLVRAAYAALLNRDPSPDELAHWCDRLAGGMTAARFLTLVRNSAEATAQGTASLAALDGLVEVTIAGHADLPGAPLRFQADAGDTVILPSLLDTGGVWEPHMTRAVIALAEEGTTMIDGGANAGYFSVLMGAIAGPRGRVVAVEPAPDARRWCERNAAVNSHPWTTVVDAGLWSEPTTLQVRVVPWATTAGHIATDRAVPLAEGEVAVDVPCTSIDALAADGALGDTRVSLVKLVVQGSEPQALRGMREVAARHRPAVICHVNPQCLGQLGQGPSAISDELRALGYAMAMLPKDHQREWAAGFPAAGSHPALGLRRVDDLDALVRGNPAADDPVDILALPA